MSVAILVEHSNVHPFCISCDNRSKKRLIKHKTKAREPTKQEQLMKRMHIMVNVSNIEESTRFYSALFNASPTVSKPGYAKWLVDDPRLNFSIKQSAHESTIEHLGFQVENPEELKILREQLASNSLATYAEGHTECCYSVSDKSWVDDPQQIKWEFFHSYGESSHLTNTPAADCCDRFTCCIE